MSGVPQFVSQWLSFLPPWMQAVFYYGVIALVLFITVILIMAFLTELLSNNAVAVLGTPIAFNIAQQLGAPAEPFVLAVLFGANLGFITPVGYQTHLLVMSAGGYKFSDFVRVGVPLQLIMVPGTAIVLPLLYDL